MPKHACWLTIAVLALGFAPAPFRKPDLNRRDLQKMQGTWVQPENPGGLRVVIKDNKLSYTRNGMVSAEYQLTLDASKKPGWYWSNGVGVSQDRKFIGVYFVDGDTLKFCYSGPGNRPTAIQEGKGTILEVYRRLRP